MDGAPKMKSRMAQICAVVALGMSLWAGNLYAGDGRFYSGDVRPANQVAVFLTSPDWHIAAVTEEGKPKKMLMPYYRMKAPWGWSPFIGEVMPGHYTLCLSGTYVDSPAAECKISLVLDAKPGHVYYIDAKYWREKASGEEGGAEVLHWLPFFVDISYDQDYDRIKYEGKGHGSPKEVRKAVEKYFKGKRGELTAGKDGYWK